MIMEETKANTESNGSSLNLAYQIDGSTEVTMSTKFGVKTEEVERANSVQAPFTFHAVVAQGIHSGIFCKENSFKITSSEVQS